MSHTPHVEIEQSLAATLAQMRHTAYELTEAMTLESDALETADTNALLRAASTKTVLMQNLEQLDVQRRHLCAASRTAEMACQSDWHELLEDLKVVKSLNMSNGTMVRLRLGFVRRALATLTGGNPEPVVYERYGQMRTELRPQTIFEC